MVDKCYHEPIVLSVYDRYLTVLVRYAFIILVQYQQYLSKLLNTRLNLGITRGELYRIFWVTSVTAEAGSALHEWPEINAYKVHFS